MSRTTRLRVLNLSILSHLTREQAVMAVDVQALHACAATISVGATLTGAETMAVSVAQRAFGAPGMLTASTSMSAPARAQLAATIATMADTAAVEQRSRIATAVATVLRNQDWTVTVVDGGAPDRYTGIEATRGTEHFVAAAGAGELIADQAGAHDCDATVGAVAASLEQIGATVTVVQDVPHDGHGGSLYAISGGPTRAHAVQASLRMPPARAVARRPRSAPAAMPLITGQR
jgi:hypothetical protein